MGMYLFRYSYTKDALKALIANPADRTKTVGAAIESLGGKQHGFWYHFGAFDGTILMEMPDDASATAFAVAVGSTDSITNIETTRLMEASDAVEAFRKAAAGSYSPPTKGTI